MTDPRPLASGAAQSAFEALLGIDQIVLDALPSAVYVCAADGVLVRYNQRAVELWRRAPQSGDTDESLCGSFRLYHLDGRRLPHADTPMAVALRTGEPQHNKEILIERPDGSRVVVRVNIEPLRGAGGRVEGAISCFDDVIQHKSTEEVSSRLAAIVETSEDAVISKDLNGIITSWNRGAERHFGYSAEEACGQPITMLIPPERQDEETRIIGCIREGKRVEPYETVRRRKDGSLVEVSLVVSPVLDSQGQVIGASKIARDLSGRRRYEQSLARRMDELAALYGFVDRLHRAGSVADIYEAALDAICSALGCSRASILLFDAAGVMRFVAWRGLSDGYRAAVDGHSPWQPGERNPEPIFVADIAATDEPEALKATVMTEGIRGLAFIPLTANGIVIGKFMTYYAAPHIFTDNEVGLAVTIAHQLGFSLERRRAEEARRAAEDELRRNEERLRLATQTGKVGLWDWDVVADRISWTDSLYSIYGVAKEAFAATVEGFADLVHPDDRERVSGAIAGALEDDAPYELEFRAVRPDGQVVWLYSNAVVLRERETPVRMLGATVDITDRKQAEEQLREKSAQLDMVMETVPAVIWIAHDREARRITGSRYAAEFLRLTPDENQSLSAPAQERPAHFRILKDGEELAPEDLPVQRAAKGEEIRDDELEVAFVDGSSRWELVNARPIRDDAGVPIGAVGAGLDITERREAEQNRKLLIDELNHRVKNTLAVVQGLAQQTFRGRKASPEARKAFEGRLAALASAHNLLARANWERALLHEIVDEAIRVCGPAEGRVSFTGPPVHLEPKQAGTIAMALHELCTNAVKYGALSNEEGGITFDWSISEAPDRRLRLAWRESGGPDVSPPKRRGFGTRMIEQALAQDLKGEVTMEFKPEGLVCTIDAPLPR